MANTFTYNYNPLSYTAASKQAAGQIDPLFKQALMNVQNQKYASDVQAGQVAASRGLGHSGLAADQLNKIAIAAQGQVADLGAQRSTQIAQMAQDLVNQDKQYSLQNRSELYNEYNNNRNYNYQQGRDKVTDSQWQKQYDYTKSQDKLANDWKTKEWNQMSPAEKAQMQLQYQYSKKASGSGGGGGGSRSRSGSGKGHGSSGSGSSSVSSKNKTKPSHQSALDRYYTNPVIQKVESTKKKNKDVAKYFTSPVSPADNPNLTDWEKWKMFGL